MENEETNSNVNENISKEQRDNWQHNFNRRPPQSRWFGGFTIIVVGIILLLSRIPDTAKIFPAWLFTWPMILIVVGFVAGARHGFRHSFFWLVPILIGVFFLLRDQNILGGKWDLYGLPIGLILLGFFSLIRRDRFNSRCAHPYNRNDMRHYEKFRRKGDRWQRKAERFGGPQFTDKSGEDYVDINSVFSNTEKIMFSKTFKGGNVSCSFGGGDLNLSQADIEDTATLSVSVTFGGLEITVPSNWTIQNELSAIMGGIEDKRRMSANTVPPKVLILRGSIFCGGIEIKN